MAAVLMIVPPERFRDEELFQTREALQDAGHSVEIASIRKGVVSGSRGGSVEVAVLLSSVDLDEYEAVVFVGGGGAKLLYDNAEALNLARDAYEKQKIVAAICLAPVILANAGILVGRDATVSGQEAKTIEAKGAIYTGPGVMVDGRIVTANAPKASRLFGRTIADVIANEQRLTSSILEGMATPLEECSDLPGWQTFRPARFLN